MTDVRLDEGDGSYLVLDARVVKAVGSDFMLDSPGSRRGGGPFRRSLVHNQDDGLTVNFDGDYPGGVTIVGVAEIVPQQDGRFTPALVVRGGISYEVEVQKLRRPPRPGEPLLSPIEITRHTVDLQEELRKLQSQISELNAKVAALEAGR